MLTILPRKLIIILVFLFAALNLWLWYFLSFSPPQNVLVTDLTNNSAVVVWNTVKPTTSNAYYSTKPFLLSFLPLTFPFVGLARDNNLTTNHRVILTKLSPGKTYHLSISQWFHFYTIQRTQLTGLNNNFSKKIPSTDLPKIQTTENNKQITNNSFLISGVVTDSKLHPVSHALVLARNFSGQTFSALTDQKGNFSLHLIWSKNDPVVFLTGQNGVGSPKNMVVAKEIIKQPILITLP